MIYEIRWNPGMTLAEVEKRAIKCAFEYFKKNKTSTARSLDISIRNLEHKIAQIEKEELDLAEKALKVQQEREEFLRVQRGGRGTGSTIPAGTTPVPVDGK